MTEIETIKKVCDIMEINFSHYDSHDMPINYFNRELTSKPKYVIYSSKCGPWEFSILEDMSIITPFSAFSKTFLDICQMTDDEFKENIEKIKNEMIKIKRSEQYLKENNLI